MAAGPMSGWFTVEQIDGDTAAISEYGHWEETHCYLLCGRERALLIDTGLGFCDIRAEVNRLTELPVTVVTTHVHADHIGGHGLFERIAVHELERGWLDGHFPLPPAAVRMNLAPMPPWVDEKNYRVFQGKPSETYRNGDVFDLGDRKVLVLHTPGHSPGHCCFYEPDRGHLYAGDLVYAGCLYAFYPSTDPAAFYRSLQRIAALDVRRLLPGHHRLDVSPALIRTARDAFASLERENKLFQGAGTFDFGEIQIKI